jgi:hypothetical protein
MHDHNELHISDACVRFDPSPNTAYFPAFDLNQIKVAMASPHPCSARRLAAGAVLREYFEMLRQGSLERAVATEKIEAMPDGDFDNSDLGPETRVSAEHVLSTLLVLALVGAVLLWSYLAPRSTSLSFPAAENPALWSEG